MSQVDPRRWWAFGALLLGMLTFGLDATILNVALPTLATAIGATTGQLQWLVAAYVLVFAGLMLPMGAMGDRYGRKRLIMVGLAVFAAGSVLATFTTDPAQLIAARALMGCAAAILTPVSMAVIPAIFAPQERGKAIAVAMMAMGAGLPLGPILGGWLLRHFWWGSIFLINVPVALVGLLAVAVLLPESRDPAPDPADLVGGLLSTIGLVAMVYGVIEAPGRGWGSGQVVSGLLLGVVVLTGFVLWERHTRNPMIDLGLFGRRRFLLGTLGTATVSFTLMGVLFVLPQYLQSVGGNDALNTGVRLLPQMVGLVLGAKIGSGYAVRFGARASMTAGLLIVAVGLGLGALTAVDTGYAFVAAWLVVTGLGVGLTLTMAMDLVLGELPPQRSGAGMGLTLTLRQVGGALGVALLGSLSSAVFSWHLDLAGLPTPVAKIASGSINGAVAVATRLGDAHLLDSARAAYVQAMAVVLLTCAGVALLGAALVGTFLPARGSVPAEDPAPGESQHGATRVEHVS